MSNQTWEQMLAAQREEQRRKEEKLQELLEQGGIKEWADKLTAEGKELKMTWDGGGDSGWVDFLIDDESPEEGEDADNAELLKDMCYHELDYGSWAGEFSANGEAVYNPEESAFVGTDYYSEDDSSTCNEPITVRIPKDVWFDQIDIALEDEEVNATVDLVVKNGFKTERHHEIETQLQEDLSNQFDEAIVIHLKHTNEQYRSMWEQITLPFSAFQVEGEERVAVINSFSIGIFNETEKDICIKIVNEEDED